MPGRLRPSAPTLGRAQAWGLRSRGLLALRLKVSVRKYVDDMVLSASGKGCAFALREAFRAVRRVLEDAGMQLNKSKCVVIANTAACRRECRRAWDRMG
eukprot:4990656-Amphidinium_carterae.1